MNLDILAKFSERLLRFDLDIDRVDTSNLLSTLLHFEKNDDASLKRIVIFCHCYSQRAIISGLYSSIRIELYDLIYLQLCRHTVRDSC